MSRSVLFGVFSKSTVSALKKTLHAAEQLRPDVVEKRANWREMQRDLPLERLFFIDETSTKTNMTRAYGRCKKGQRLVDYTPHGHWNTTTFIAALTLNGMVAPMMLNSGMDGDAFLVYLEKFLIPCLKIGDIVILDNLPTHKIAKAKEKIEAVGAKFLFLPPYSPDLNPIENAFAKLKNYLRKSKARTLEALENAIAEIIELFPKEQCINFFKNAGYKSI
jgi:transposase